ncbi:MAG: hypothetical protein U5L96_04155 [Owenweeksia sp.]|nr:hypothetical protein [Owenweeksia sp.]
MIPSAACPTVKANKADNFDNPEFMARYFKTYGAANRLEEGELAKYFNQFELEEWTTEANWDIIYANARSYESEVFQTVLENQQKFEKAQGAGSGNVCKTNDLQPPARIISFYPKE